MTTGDEERAYWDAQCSSEEAAIGAIAADHDAWYGGQLRQSLERIEPALSRARPGARVLDLGCGIGRLTIPAASFRPRCQFIGVDVSPKMLALAKQRALWGKGDSKSGTQATNIDWLLCDGRTLPETGPLDAAFSMITFQHMPREAQAGYIRQIAERLVPGGVFRFQVLQGERELYLAHHVTYEWVEHTCASAGFSMLAWEGWPSNVDPDVITPWVTAVKHS